MKKKFFILVSLFSMSMLAAYAESIKVTTFFPSPKGAYRRLETSGKTLLASSGGSVGIGIDPKTTLTEKLEVLGQVRINDGSAGANKVLVAQDSSGRAYWKGGPCVSDVAGVGSASYLAKGTGGQSIGPSSLFYVHNANYRFVRVGIGTT